MKRRRLLAKVRRRPRHHHAEGERFVSVCLRHGPQRNGKTKKKESSQDSVSHGAHRRPRTRGAQNLLLSNETTDGDTSPTHATRHASSKTFAAAAVGMVAIRVCHGDGLRARADKRVLATAAQGRVKIRASGHVDVGVEAGRARRRPAAVSAL